MIEIHSKLVHHRQQHIGHRRLVCDLHMVVSSYTAAVSHQHDWNALMVVYVRVAHRATIKCQTMIEQAAITVRCVLQLLEEVAQKIHVVFVDLGELSDMCRSFAVMGTGVKGN